MKNFLKLAKLATMMMIFAIGFTQQANAQRYLTENVQKDLIVAEGLKVAHTFGNTSANKTSNIVTETTLIRKLT